MVRRREGGNFMSTVTQRATLDDLYRTEGKAELIGGRIVEYMATGIRPSEVASNVYDSLRDYVKHTGRGRAFNDGVGYAIPELLSGRESFSPDASYYSGPMPANLMRFVVGPPTFAVEVRSENDYIPSAELDIAAKRADYFAAGTLVVWDVDPIAEAVSVYRADAPDRPERFTRGQGVAAEPALPGWQMPVDRIFP
jgi:Uma2 family endonuclease